MTTMNDELKRFNTIFYNYIPIALKSRTRANIVSKKKEAQLNGFVQPMTSQVSSSLLR